MNDLDICKRIAIIEKHFIDCESVDSIIIFNGGDGKVYNPLTDDALCFQLMVKYEVNIIMNDMYCCKINEGETPFACISNGAQVNRKKTEELTTITTTIKIRKNASYNKAICLAIIEAHKEQ